MGESKIPFFAYVDETGNTGHNLFDEAQPDFYTAALITRGDFDAVFGADVMAIADKLGVKALHGKELGVHRIAAIAPDIIRLLSRAKASFFISRVEKIYLLATKVFDTFFDSGENAAVAWHHYNYRPFKLMLVFKLATRIDYETAKQFWRCILEPKEEKATAMIPEICRALKDGLVHLKDASARKVLVEGLDWAEKFPECIHIHTDRRSARQGHFPNMVAFANLLEGLEEHSRRFKRPVARITHDTQGEFEKTLAAWHEMYSNASPETLEWAGETYSMQRVVGSTFEVKEDHASAGIQVTDIVLWLYHQSQKEKDLPGGCIDLLHYAYENGWNSDFSFKGVGEAMDARLAATMDAPFTAEQAREARERLSIAEEARLKSMQRYETDGLPPFMRRAADREDSEAPPIGASK